MESTDPAIHSTTEDTGHAESGHAESGRAETFVRRVVLAGWICLAISAACLALVGFTDPASRGSGMMVRVCLWMMARMFGLATFAIGCIAIYNHRWTTGVFLLLLAVILPVLAFLAHGTI